MTMNNRTCVMDLQQNFFKAPTPIFSMGLDATAVAVYLFMCSCHSEFEPSMRYIAQRLSISRSTAKKSIKILLDKGIIQEHSAAFTGVGPTYSFVPLPTWYNQGGD